MLINVSLLPLERVIGAFYSVLYWCKMDCNAEVVDGEMMASTLKFQTQFCKNGPIYLINCFGETWRGTLDLWDYLINS